MKKSLLRIKKAIEQELDKIGQSGGTKQPGQRRAFLKLQAAYLQLEEGLSILANGHSKDGSCNHLLSQSNKKG